MVRSLALQIPYPYDWGSSGSLPLGLTQGRVTSGFLALALVPAFELGSPPKLPLSPQSTPSRTSAEKAMRTVSFQSAPASRRRRCSNQETWRAFSVLSEIGFTYVNWARYS